MARAALNALAQASQPNPASDAQQGAQGLLCPFSKVLCYTFLVQLATFTQGGMG